MPKPPPLFERLFTVDLRSLAALRIGLGAMVAIDMVGRLLDVEAHYTDTGTFPSSALREWWNNSFWALATLFAVDGGTAWAAFLLILTLGCALLFLVGWQSRFAAAATWFLMVSIHNRNPLILHGGDQMLRILLFWSMFLPMGARWSADGAVAKLRAYGQTVPDTTFSVGSAALILQTAIVYWGTAALKTGREWWAEGSAVWYAFQIEQYELPLGKLCRGLPLPILKLMTWGTMALEWLGPVVALVPRDRLRVLMVAVFFGFHLLTIAPFMDVGPISFASCLLWLPYLPGSFWDALGARVRASAPLRPLVGVADRVRAARERAVERWVAARKPLPQIAPSMPMQICAVFCLAFVLQWNVANALGKRGALGTFATVVRQDQHWAMFAPRPMVDDGWYTMPALLSDGSKVDLFRDGAPLSADKPAYVPAGYANARWAKYYMNLWQQRYAPYRRYLIDWKRRAWNARHPDRQATAVSLIFNLQISPPPGGVKSPPKRVTLWAETLPGVPGPPVEP